ncbi:MBL fold metallo-hydrolase [Fusibacter sp. 3D3]|uniref:MBL fold metallo-hydrolase n=1 Tax=Fusibacter sp. 3D3 TaxID=1048380 RepID=UPI000852DCE0|nr:MBL fold metallo-hydrolase [Fusibacter sp. 3D3]GAU79481.1 metal-dependent hydrolase [Fusibacter sp. 3D3]
MKLTIVGSRGAYPLEGEATSCYLIQDNDTNIVLDFGAGSLAKIQQFIALEQIDAVLITHYHPDHFSDIFCLQHAFLIKNQLGEIDKKLRIYAPNHEPYFSQMTLEMSSESIPIKGQTVIKLGDMTLEFLETKHIIYSLAIKLTKGDKSIVYTSDTELTDELIEFSKGCHVLLCECSLYQPIPEIKGHMSTLEVEKLIELSGPRMTLLTHLPPYGRNELLLENIKPYPIALASAGVFIDCHEACEHSND